jgi:hypothetical protein
MQNGNGGISPDLDRRGWMPDCKPKEVDTLEVSRVAAAGTRADERGDNFR